MEDPDIDLLSRRSGYLDVLDVEARRKAELEAALDHSRSTVNRAVAELVEAGLVEERGGECRLTFAGRLAAEAFAEFRDRAGGVVAARELLASLPPADELDLAVTTGADVYPASGQTPYRAFHEFERLVEDATRIRGSATTFANPRAGELFEDAIVERGIPVEFYFDESLYWGIRDEFADAFDRWRDVGDFSGFVVEGCPGFTLLRSALPAGPEMGIAVYSADREFAGVLVNDAADAVRWANRRLDALAGRADPLPPIE